MIGGSATTSRNIFLPLPACPVRRAVARLTDPGTSGRTEELSVEPQGPWFKMFHEWSHDLKVQTLSEADQRRHVMLMCLHARGEEPSVERYSVAMRISVAELRETVARLRASGLKVGDDCSLASWKRRQGPSPAQRKRKERQEHKRRHTDVARQSHDCRKIVADVSHVDLDGDRDAEERREDHPLPPPEPSSGGCAHGDIRVHEVPHADDPRWKAQAPAPTKDEPDCEKVCSTEQGRACVVAKVRPGSTECDAVISERMAEQHDERKAKEPAIPYDDIVAAYHEKLPTLAGCRSHGHESPVRRNIKARWEACTERQNIAWWAEYFTDVAEMPWLMGEETGKDGRAPFKATLPWLVLPTNMDKVLNGFYQRKAKSAADDQPDESKRCPGCYQMPGNCYCEVKRDQERRRTAWDAAQKALAEAKGAPGAHD